MILGHSKVTYISRRANFTIDISLVTSFLSKLVEAKLGCSELVAKLFISLASKAINNMLDLTKSSHCTAIG